MEISESDSDRAVLEELGRRLAQRRIAIRLSQAELAERAGVGKRTLERIESGESAQATTLVRVLRVLDLLPALNQLIPADPVGPMALLRSGGKAPKRVRKSQQASDDSNPASPWRWSEPDGNGK